MSNENIHYSEKLTAIRAQMKQHAVQAYMIPRGDEYLGEFVAPYAERLRYISGFTGSAGLAIIMEERAFALTDARYTIQIAAQVDTDCFEVGDYISRPPVEWIMDHAQEGDIVGYDPHLHTAAQIEKMEKELAGKNIMLKPISDNLVDQIWDDQPAKPQGKVIAFPEYLAGLSVAQKIDIICETLAEEHGLTQGTLLITLPDSIGWLLNIRGSDTEYIPQILSIALVDLKHKTVRWFVAKEKLSITLPDEITICDPNSLKQELYSLNGALILDSKRAPIWFKGAVSREGVDLHDIKDPCILPKSLKTEAEQEALKEAHIIDGVALVKFLHWFETELASGADLYEYETAEKLESLRREHDSYRGASFPTICGAGANGAIVHYRATAENNTKIERDTLLLIDSGGQYLGAEPHTNIAGTTDITRTIATGVLSDEIKAHYTLVLKGHIALAMAQFPYGTKGAQVDVYARKPLWDAHIDFAHGTGHGVGCFGAVHEEAASISPRGAEVLQPGMLISNEPGYYQEDSHGIRTENLVLVKVIGENPSLTLPMLGFETVTLCPIDMGALDVSLLSEEEKGWLNRYHKRVYETLSPRLDEERTVWLREKTHSV